MNHFGGFVIVKSKLTLFFFLHLCPLIDDKLRRYRNYSPAARACRVTKHVIVSCGHRCLSQILCLTGETSITSNLRLIPNSECSFVDVFVFPKNGETGANGYALRPIPDGAPADYYVPPLTSHNGANYYDRGLSTLFVVLRGSVPVDLRVMPVVQVRKNY